MSLVGEWVRQLEFFGVVSSIPSGGNFIFADFETLDHPAGTSEISDLCGNISNFGLNVSL